MRRLLLAALTAAAPVTFVAADDEKGKPKSVPATLIQTKPDDKKADDKTSDTKPKTRTEQLAAMTRELLTKRSEMVKEINGMAPGDDRNKKIQEYMSLGSSYAKKMLDLAKEDTKDDASMRAALAAMQNAGPQGKIGGEASNFLIENFANDEKIVASIPMIAQVNPKALETLSTKSTKKEVKGTALFMMVDAEVDNADYPRTGEPLPAEETAAKLAAASAKLKDIVKDYGDVEVKSRIGKTIAEAAKTKQFFIDNLTVGKVAPDFECEMLDDKKAKLSDFRGNVVVLDIWATWCGPCRAMIPHERELVEKLKSKPFKLISLSADEKKETLTKFLEKEEMPWVHLWNGSKGNMLEKYQVRFYPTIYVLDAKGVIRYKHVRGEKMDQAVEALLKESTK